MNVTSQFDAPWSRELRLMTVLGFAIGFGIPLIGFEAFPGDFIILRQGIMITPILFLVCCAFFMVRGYTVEDHKLIINRLGWSSRFDLASLVSAVYDPLAVSGSIRIAGNGGLFAFCGLFRNQKLGNFRAFATDLHRSVILRFADRVIVVTPDAPERFVDEITKRK